MKTTFLLTTVRTATQRIPLGLVVAVALCLHHNATAADVLLGTANDFAVLAGSTVTDTGSSVISRGNVGVYAGSAVTGLLPGQISPNPPYTIHAGDAVAQQAQTELSAAYTIAAGLTPFTDLTGQDLGGLTLNPGVYRFSSSAGLTGTLTLNDQGNPDAVFVFQIGSTLITASSSSVVTINAGPNPPTPGVSVFWQVGSSATLGTGTDFEGNILASASITANTGAEVDGRLLAETGAVTLDDNTITVPPAEVPATVPDTASTLLLLGFGVAALFAFGRRLACPA